MIIFVTNLVWSGCAGLYGISKGTRLVPVTPWWKTALTADRIEAFPGSCGSPFPFFIPCGMIFPDPNAHCGRPSCPEKQCLT